MKTLMTDHPTLEAAMKPVKGGMQRDLKSWFRLASGSTVEAKVIEAAASGRLRIEVLGNTQTAILDAASPDQNLTRPPENLLGKTAVFRVLSVGPDLVLAREQTPLEEKGAEFGRLPGVEFPKDGSEKLSFSSLNDRTGRQIQGRLVALEGRPEPPSESSPGGYRAVLEVNGKNISVWLDRPSTVGQSHLFTVMQTKPGLQLSVADAQGDVSVQTVNYRNDSLLFAKVLQIGTGNPDTSSHFPAKVEIGGQIVNVMLEGPVQEGETHLFRVASGKGLPLLVPVLGDEQNVGMLAANLKSFLSAQQSGTHLYDPVIRSLMDLAAVAKAESPARETVEEVLKLVRSITYGEEQVGKADFFQRFLDLSGYTLEADLAAKGGGGADGAVSPQDNLKSLLMKLDGQLTEMLEQGRQGDGPSDLHHLSMNAQGPVRNLLQHILATQVVNTVAFHEEGSLTFEVPFSWAGHVETGRLTVRFKHDDEDSQRKERPSPTEIMVVFLLDLENMGPLRVDAYLKKNDRISVTVMAERPDVASYVRDRIHELSEGLTHSGFSVEQISCLQVHRRRIQEETAPPVAHLIDSDQMHIVA
jgi:hypothetical protein